MRHELFIDGVEINLPDDFDFAMLYQSWFFQDITSIVSNRTYTVKLPLTPRNVQAIGYSSYEDIISDYPYRKHVVDYYRNGFWIIRRGLAVITSIDANINFVFGWGVIPNFTLLSDVSLRDLDDGTYYEWSDASLILTNSDNFGLYLMDFGKGLQDLQYVHPSAKASFIIKRINAKYGINIDLPEAEKYLVPLLTKNGGVCNQNESKSKYGQTLISNGYSTILKESGEHYNDYFFIDSDMVLPTNDGVITGMVGAKCVGKLTITLDFDYHEEYIVIEVNDVSHKVYGTYKFTESSVQYYSYTDAYEFTISEAGEMFGVRCTNAGSKSGISYTISLLPDEYTFGSHYSVFANLPDMGVIDFIKSIMFCENLFAYPDEKDNSIVHFESVDVLIDNKAGAVNWTDKLVNEMPAFSKPASSEYNFNSMAKKNRLMWNNDDDDDKSTPDFSGYLTVLNRTIDDKKDLLTIPTFQGTEEKAGFAYIPLYNSDGELQSVTPRLLTIQIQNGVAQGRFAEPGNNLSFSAPDGIIARKYSGYQSLITKPRYLKINCVLSDLDLFNLKLDVPVYFEQYGAYYGIIKIQVRKNNLCACEFLKLPVKEVAKTLVYSFSGYVCERVDKAGTVNLISAKALDFTGTGYKTYLQVSSATPVTHDVYVAVRITYQKNALTYGEPMVYVMMLEQDQRVFSADLNTGIAGVEIAKVEILDIAITPDGADISSGGSPWYQSSFTGLTGSSSDGTYTYVSVLSPTNTGYKRQTDVTVSDGNTYYIEEAFDSYPEVSKSVLSTMPETDFKSRFDAFCDMIESNYVSMSIDRQRYRELNVTDCPLS